jgi:hypothetical protein
VHPLRATVEQLEALHGLIAEVLLTEIRRRNARKGRKSSRFLSVALQFLKVNGITSPSQSQAAIDALLGELPQELLSDD